MYIYIYIYVAIHSFFIHKPIHQCLTGVFPVTSCFRTLLMTNLPILRPGDGAGSSERMDNASAFGNVSAEWIFDPQIW